MAGKKIEMEHDRVVLSMNRKFNLGNYESVDVFASLASSVELDETTGQAFKRVHKSLRNSFMKIKESVLDDEEEREK